jgi:hypothetical protein
LPFLSRFGKIRLLDAFFYLIETADKIPELLITPGTHISA